MISKLYAGFTKYLHAHASGAGAALVLILDKMAANAPFDKPALSAIIGAYLGVGGLVSALPHGGKGAGDVLEDALAPGGDDYDDAPHDDGTEDDESMVDGSYAPGEA